MNTYIKNFIKPKSSDKDYGYAYFQGNIKCNYKPFDGEDVVNRFVLGTWKSKKHKAPKHNTNLPTIHHTHQFIWEIQFQNIANQCIFTIRLRNFKLE